MSIFDLVFSGIKAEPDLQAAMDANQQREQEQAETRRLAQLRTDTSIEALKIRIDDLESELRLVVLLLAGLLSTLDEKGVLSREDVLREMSALDVIDGRRDDQFNIRALKQYLRDRGA